MINTHYFKTLLTLAALMGMTACGGGGDSGSTPAPPPPAAPASFSFPVVSTTPPAPQGCVREDGKQGVPAVTYTQQNLAGDRDLVVLSCASSSGQRILLAQAGVTPTLHYIDAAGTVVASRGFALFAMLPGSTQEIVLATGSALSTRYFIGVFNDRVLYVTSEATSALVSVTLSQTPTTTVLAEVSGTMRVHDRLVGGRIFFATIPAGPPAVTEYLSIRPDGTDRLLLRTVSGKRPSGTAPTFEVHVLRDREVIYSEQTDFTVFPTSIRMLAIDTPGSDLMIAADASSVSQILTVPGAPDRFVFVARYPNTAAPVLTEVNAQRANFAVKTIQHDAVGFPIGFSQGRLYMAGALPPMPNLLRGWVNWLGEGNTAPRTVLTELLAAFTVTDLAIVYSRSPILGNRTSFARSDLDGSNERAGSSANGASNLFSYTQAGERIYYHVFPDLIIGHVAALDLATGIETVVYQPNPPQAFTQFFRVGDRLIVWGNSPPGTTDPPWIDSVDLDGNDRRRLAQSPGISEVKPF